MRGELGLEYISDMANWVSSLLDVRFDISGSELVLIRSGAPPFVSYQEGYSAG